MIQNKITLKYLFFEKKREFYQSELSPKCYKYRKVKNLYPEEKKTRCKMSLSIDHNTIRLNDVKQFLFCSIRLKMCWKITQHYEPRTHIKYFITYLLLRALFSSYFLFIKNENVFMIVFDRALCEKWKTNEIVHKMNSFFL